MIRVFAFGLALLWLSGCGEPAPTPRAVAPPEPTPAVESAPAVAAAPKPEPESSIPLDRLLTPPVDPEAGEPESFRDYRHSERPGEAVPIGQQLPVPEWLGGELTGGARTNEVVGPGRTVESREVGASVGVIEDDIEVSIKGKVREDTSDSFPEAEGRDQSIGLEITIPLDED